MKLVIALTFAASLTLSSPVSAETVEPEYTTVTVRSGDTLGRIATRYSTTVEDLLAVNGLKNPNRVFAGQKLRVPVLVPPKKAGAPEIASPAAAATPVPPAAKPSAPTMREAASLGGRRSVTERVESPSQRRNAERFVLLKHWVREGETVADIAATYGVASRAIIETNGIRLPNDVPVGMVLWIPKEQTRAPKVQATRFIKGLNRGTTKSPAKPVVRAAAGARATPQDSARKLAKPKRQHRLGAIVSP